MIGVRAARSCLRQPPLEHLAGLAEPVRLAEGDQRASARLAPRPRETPQSGEGELGIPRPHASYLEAEASVPAHDRPVEALAVITQKQTEGERRRRGQPAAARRLRRAR